ncbi:hypothetical protein [Amycolatopsis cihanbeyliensis]|uniref:Uncharacterized protein n=1 Tax=Amycolatopsis cihanbeyliensis TaxID=1128664 RepID=A0A542DQJ9_AMYCI|nr:hypothetical protein [Amycolatopsis cihanbeyliensis]TQJ05380.1 hypothetical protein FB471_5209 [Amycolatopsis cihanbeyliensis]
MTQWNAQVPAEPGRDDTTRYLCAAAHLDSDYADGAIREFLVEPTRPVPPSPGVHAASVLAEAVAARTRRKLRDGVLAVLMLLFLLSGGVGLLGTWVLLAVLICLPAMVRGKRGDRSVAARTTRVLIVFALLAVVLAVSLTDTLLEFAEEMEAGVAFDYWITDTWDVIGLVTLVLMPAVLVADRMVVWRLVTVWFGRLAGRRPADPFATERPLFGISPPRFLHQVRRYQEEAPAGSATPGAPLVVYRGFDPFVGAGHARHPWSVAVPLEKLPEDTKPDGSPFEELSTELLYQRVREAMAVLPESTALSPDRRLRELRSTGVVFASSDELIDNVNNPVARSYLPRLDAPPADRLPAEEVDPLRTQPREWARYYLRFRVETWDRDLVMSMHLHAAVDPSTLYLEWTPCVLPPIKPEYQAIDTMARNSLVPVGQGLLRWLKLPVTILARLRHTLSWIRPLPHDPSVLVADRYGSLHSLRELAAAPEVQNYFQLLDIERYDKIMESRLLPAIIALMRDAGYSPAEFERQVSTVVHNSVNIHGTNYGAFNAGGTTHGPMSGATAGKERIP